MQPHGPGNIFFARDKKEEADLWAARKEALWTMTSIKPEGYALWSTDVAVPISRLAEIISTSDTLFGAIPIDMVERLTVENSQVEGRFRKAGAVCECHWARRRREFSPVCHVRPER